jgi:DNA-binding NtrC family response regulator
MKKPKLLIVEDNRALALALIVAGEKCGYEVSAAPSLALARKLILGGMPDMLLDLGLPDGRGFDLLESFKNGVLPITAMLTAHGEIDHAISAKKLGVTEFFVKPVDFTDLERFLTRAAQQGAKHDEGREFSMSFIGTSVKMRGVFQKVAQACASDQPVVIQGAEGSGRSHVAHLIHQHIDGKGDSVVVNCGEFSGDWREVMKKSQGGSVVLDGVDALPLESQLMLEPIVGECKDVKWIAITGEKGLRDAVRDHAFHPDLYYRLQGVVVALPKLNERMEDFRALCSLFLAELDSSRTLILNEDIFSMLESNLWLGNLRELKNVLRYAVITSEGRTALRLEDFPDAYRQGKIRDRRGFERALEEWVNGWLGDGFPDYDDIHDHLERMLLEILLDRFDGNQANLARNMKMNRATLRKKLKRD